MFRRAELVVFFCAVAAWIVCAVFVPSSGQRKALLFNGKYPLYDHENLRRVVEMEQPYSLPDVEWRVDGGRIERKDVCYPALAMWMVEACPHSALGGWIFVGFGAILYLLAACCFLKERGGTFSYWHVLLLMGSHIFLFAVHVANMITYAVAAALLFLAWYDSEVRWKRIAAAVALPFAVVLKIAPALLGVLYLSRGNIRKRWPLMMLAGSLTVLMFAIPFSSYGGWEAVKDWFANAKMNSEAYADANYFGVRGLVCSVITIFGCLGETPKIVFSVTRIISLGVAFACLLLGCRAKIETSYRLCLVVLGMLFLPPTMMIYCYLYLLPLLLLLVSDQQQRISTSAKVAFMFLAIPLQIPFVFGSLNTCFATAAVLDLMLAIMCISVGSIRDEMSGRRAAR